jgi:hypothetical protein
MPYATTPVPKAPDVPKSNGVPAIFRDPTRIVFTIRLIEADIATVLRMFGPPEWGVFTTGGAPVLIPDSIVSVDIRREWRISDYPVERGGFQSFDKVGTPFDARVRMAVSGAEARGPFLARLDAVAASLDLFTVVTPDALYPSVNIVHYDYRREQRSGASLLLIDVWLQEVRVTAQAQFTETKTPEGAANAAGGNVQGTPPTPAQAAKVTRVPSTAGLENIGSPGGAGAPPEISTIT